MSELEDLLFGKHRVAEVAYFVIPATGDKEVDKSLEALLTLICNSRSAGITIEEKKRVVAAFASLLGPSRGAELNKYLLFTLWVMVEAQKKPGLDAVQMRVLAYLDKRFSECKPHGAIAFPESEAPTHVADVVKAARELKIPTERITYMMEKCGIPMPESLKDSEAPKAPEASRVNAPGAALPADFTAVEAKARGEFLTKNAIEVVNAAIACAVERQLLRHVEQPLRLLTKEVRESLEERGFRVIEAPADHTFTIEW